MSEFTQGPVPYQTRSNQKVIQRRQPAEVDQAGFLFMQRQLLVANISLETVN